ncbi:hypothetical protein AB4Y30_08485 [Ornithinibacillus sp. 4-3]|uniref:DUF4352 domain-containing protein n=1 Tax=Ornithinibacillus sp. 4-3 TaxID=3231488 RepID=A0AB39HVK4_9BACI
MKKVLFLLFALVLAGFLVACGDESEEKEIENVNSEGEKQAEQDDADAEQDEADKDSEEATDEGSEDTESTTYDEVLLDDENAKVTLKSIEKVSDDIFGDEYQVKMEIENKLDQTIEVQSREASIDGFMVDDMVIFSETVAGGKKSNAELSIMAFDDELPEMNENLEFTLVVLDDGFMDITSANVNIDIK